MVVAAGPEKGLGARQDRGLQLRASLVRHDDVCPRARVGHFRRVRLPSAVARGARGVGVAVDPQAGQGQHHASVLKEHRRRQALLRSAAEALQGDVVVPADNHPLPARRGRQPVVEVAQHALAAALPIERGGHEDVAAVQEHVPRGEGHQAVPLVRVGDDDDAQRAGGLRGELRQVQPQGRKADPRDVVHLGDGWWSAPQPVAQEQVPERRWQRRQPPQEPHHAMLEAAGALLVRPGAPSAELRLQLPADSVRHRAEPCGAGRRQRGGRWAGRPKKRA
mmetsp:Transcript_91394/g.242755  ORF Transcript_91394/g.242755 Transcript_91394/m.242755 type:complete len:278 (+) Transcript_91394:203-1036(+)